MNIFAPLLSAMLIFTALTTPPAPAPESAWIMPKDLKRAQLIAQSSAGENGVFKSYIDAEGRLINARETDSGFLEYAYNEDGDVHSFEFQNGFMVKHTVLTNEDFGPEIIEEISPKIQQTINEVMARKSYESAGELERALEAEGVSASVYEDSDGSLIIDPFVSES